MEIYPISLIDVPATLAMDHMTIGRVLCQLFLLAIDYVFSQVHLISVLATIVHNIEAGTWYRRRLSLQVTILNDFIWIELLLMLAPLLVLDRGKEEI